jgi:hypothetical protein
MRPFTSHDLMVTVLPEQDVALHRSKKPPCTPSCTNTPRGCTPSCTNTPPTGKKCGESRVSDEDLATLQHDLRALRDR